MHKKITGAIIALLIFVVLFSVLKTYLNKDKNYININGTKIYVEIADNDLARMKGLMYRKHLDDNRGMLFIFNEEGKHSFWMKNTLIPLDMLWIDAANKIVYIENSAPPCKQEICPTYHPEVKAKYVLELPGGYSIKNNIKPGDEVTMDAL